MGGRRYQKGLWVTEPNLRGVSEAHAHCAVFQVWAPFSCTLCTRGSGESRWIPTTSRTPWSQCRGPHWLLALTSMLVSHGGRKGWDMAFPSR